MPLRDRHVRLRAALVLVPLFRQKQPPIERAARLISRGVDRDADLAVGDLPECAAVLPRHPDRLAAGLRKAGVVDDPRLWLDRRAQLPRQTPPHRLPLPRALVDELLQALLVPVRQPSRHRFDRLPLPVQHQPAQIDLAPAALIAPRQRRQHLLRERDQPPPHTRQLRRPHQLTTRGIVSSHDDDTVVAAFAAAPADPAST